MLGKRAQKTMRAVLFAGVMAWVAAGAACGSKVTKPTVGGTTGGADAGVDGGTSGSTGTSGSSGTSGATGTADAGPPPQPGVVAGAISYNAQALAHAGTVLVYDRPVFDGGAVIAQAATYDGGAYAVGPLDAGDVYLYAIYNPGDADAGDYLLADGGLAPGWVAGTFLGNPVHAGAGQSNVDVDLSEIDALLASFTINVGDLFGGADAGVPAGGYPLPDGGQLFPLLLAANVGGVNPVDGLPVVDPQQVSFGPDAGPTLGMGLDSTTKRWTYATPALNQTSSWQAAQSSEYFFTLIGSPTLGATVTRQLSVSPLAGVPLITAPLDGTAFAPSTSSITVSWVDPPSAQGAEIKVYEIAQSPATDTVLCDLPFPQQNPRTLSAGNCGAFLPQHSYRIEVISSRIDIQAQGATLAAAYARVRVSF